MRIRTIYITRLTILHFVRLLTVLFSFLIALFVKVAFLVSVRFTLYQYQFTITILIHWRVCPFRCFQLLRSVQEHSYRVLVVVTSGIAFIS